VHFQRPELLRIYSWGSKQSLPSRIPTIANKKSRIYQHKIDGGTGRRLAICQLNLLDKWSGKTGGTGVALEGIKTPTKSPGGATRHQQADVN